MSGHSPAFSPHTGFALALHCSLAALALGTILLPRQGEPAALISLGGDNSHALAFVLSDTEARLLGTGETIRAPIVVTDNADPLAMLLQHGVLMVSANPRMCKSSGGLG